ncbi:MAG TPA: hypothetical protein ENI87_05435 [bacterium]|nr:hypothetical protein [bacterium]
MPDLLFVDFETYYDSDYSLRRMSPWEYVADPRFEVQCVAVAGLHGPPRVMPPERFVSAPIDWANTVCIAHNAMFDALVARKLGIRPRGWLCTMQMANPDVWPFMGSVSLAALAKQYGLDVEKETISLAAGQRLVDMTPEFRDRYLAYAGRDVELCRELFRRLWPTFDRREARLLAWTVRRSVEPAFLVDPAPLRDAIMQREARIRTKLDRFGLTKTDVASSLRFAAILENHGVEVATKPGKNGPIPALAVTDPFMAELLEYPDPVVAELAELRVEVKSTITSSRAQRFLDISGALDGYLPVPLNYHRARTGRWTGAGGINLQNLSRGDSPLRRSLTAAPGKRLVVVDASQIEARITAWLAGCRTLVDLFASGADVYAEFAGRMYRRRIDKKTDPVERFIGKTAVLSCGYGTGAAKFRNMTRIQGHGVDVSTAENAVRTFRRVFHEIPELWRTFDGMLRVMAAGGRAAYRSPLMAEPLRFDGSSIVLPTGRRIYYPNLRYDADSGGYVFDRFANGRPVPQHVWGGVVTENVVQALARDVLCEVHAEYVDETVLQVHDELVGIVDEDGAEDLRDTWVDALRRPPEWLGPCPLDAEGAACVNYAEGK